MKMRRRKEERYERLIKAFLTVMYQTLVSVSLEEFLADLRNPAWLYALMFCLTELPLEQQTVWLKKLEEIIKERHIDIDLAFVLKEAKIVFDNLNKDTK
ncbi:MAG: hypothetical protein QG648_302 [Patescibacteria group bacterium]|nr:hypothetical protein [Patescibacteria group bacterium]